MCTKQWSILYLYHSLQVLRVCEETHKYLWRWQKSKHGNVRSRKTGAHVVLPSFLNNITDVNWPGHDQPKRAGTFFRSRWIRFHYHLVNWSYCFCVCHFPKKISTFFFICRRVFHWLGLTFLDKVSLLRKPIVLNCFTVSRYSFGSYLLWLASAICNWRFGNF